ncbi:DUF2384 domain-containing protein [Pseudomonas sp. PB101]|uniref:type II RES/Xre toxin-antitoxin system antitoxin n=1 Tax=Pseudomonas sp. PB101 TaxID=2495428 RepID=UPI0013667C99|nr:antitoxin Xre/MbcA/ParS toxin-binding domain-containing protein [Pseudomonas sp. PB101]MVW84390.1 DUF2384 domain-containing protein [Pseudomonas sp. PB101]
MATAADHPSAKSRHKGAKATQKSNQSISSDLVVVEVDKHGTRKKRLAIEVKHSFDVNLTKITSMLMPGLQIYDDRIEVFRATQAGFRLGSVIEMVESVQAFRDYDVLTRIIGLSARTVARRMKNPDEALTPEQSARALHYAEVLEKAIGVFGSRELAEEWMTKPALGLDGDSPIDLLSNSVGHEIVSDFLTRLEYGVY